MIALALTTATPRCEVALVDGDALLASDGYEDERRHAERLFPTLQRVLDASGRQRADIQLVACDIGPGSFTGVRVGLASAKGIALALDVPLVGICSLEAMAAAALSLPASDAELVACVIDAKRGETFYAVYDRTRSPVVGPAHAAAGTVRAALGELGQRDALVFCGRAAAGEIAGEVDGERLLADPSCELPSARHVAQIGLELLAQDGSRSLDEVEPLYLRAPDVTMPKPR